MVGVRQNIKVAVFCAVKCAWAAQPDSIGRTRRAKEKPCYHVKEKGEGVNDVRASGGRRLVLIGILVFLAAPRSRGIAFTKRLTSSTKITTGTWRTSSLSLASVHEVARTQCRQWKALKGTRVENSRESLLLRNFQFNEKFSIGKNRHSLFDFNFWRSV